MVSREWLWSRKKTGQKATEKDAQPNIGRYGCSWGTLNKCPITREFCYPVSAVIAAVASLFRFPFLVWCISRATKTAMGNFLRKRVPKYKLWEFPAWDIPQVFRRVMLIGRLRWPWLFSFRFAIPGPWVRGGGLFDVFGKVPVRPILNWVSSPEKRFK